MPGHFYKFNLLIICVRGEHQACLCYRHEEKVLTDINTDLNHNFAIVNSKRLPNIRGCHQKKELTKIQKWDSNFQRLRFQRFRVDSFF